MPMATAMVMVTTVMAKVMVKAMQQRRGEGMLWVDDEMMTVATWEDKL